eukprot:317419-Rhodomonas_salina.1
MPSGRDSVCMRMCVCVELIFARSWGVLTLGFLWTTAVTKLSTMLRRGAAEGSSGRGMRYVTSGHLAREK